MQRDELVTYLADLLGTSQFEDYGPNGLQVEGKAEINRIVTGVTASHALLEAAVAKKADAVLVHHGIFWNKDSLPVVGYKQRRIKSLLLNDINLLAYHLPLDDHQTLGNNAQLAKLLDIQVEGVSVPHVWYGTLHKPQDAQSFGQLLQARLQHEPLCIDAGSHPIKRIAWCTGGAQGFLEQAASLGVDAYISGEVSEATFHLAKELRIHYFAAGHHATERGGPQALGEHLAQQFGIQCEFVDIINPV